MFNWLTNMILNFKIFGIRPFNGLYTLLCAPGFWSVLLGVGFVCLIIYKLFGPAFFAIIAHVSQKCFKLIKNIIKVITYFIKETYMMIMFSNDSKKNGYDKAEYWGRRQLTVKGIVSADVTGVELLVINHPVIIKKAILGVIIAKRAFENLLLLVKERISIIKSKIKFD